MSTRVVVRMWTFVALTTCPFAIAMTGLTGAPFAVALAIAATLLYTALDATREGATPRDPDWIRRHVTSNLVLVGAVGVLVMAATAIA